MKYNSQYKQLTLDAFRSSLDGLDKANRWVMLGDMLPWDKIERLYNSKLNNETCGAGNKSARMVIGALIIKHKMRLSDEETILAIQENPYMQYMVGLQEFTDKKIFDPSLFVTIRKRLGTEDCNEMSVELLREQLRLEEEKRRSESEGKNDDSQDSGVDCTPGPSAEQESSETEYTFIDHHSWDAYDEESDLSSQIELFKERFGYLPAVLDADKIYMNRSNRDKLKDLEVKAYCTPLGRPPKEASTPEYKAKMAKAIGERNEIEATFGTGKRIYGANNIRAKLKDTAECWTGMCYFVKNVMKFLRELCHVLTLIWLYIVNFIIWQKTVRTPALVKI